MLTISEVPVARHFIEELRRGAQGAMPYCSQPDVFVESGTASGVTRPAPILFDSRITAPTNSPSRQRYPAPRPQAAWSGSIIRNATVRGPTVPPDVMTQKRSTPSRNRADRSSVGADPPMDPFELTPLGRSGLIPKPSALAAPIGDNFDTVRDAQADDTLTAAWNVGIRYYDRRLGTAGPGEPRSAALRGLPMSEVIPVWQRWADVPPPCRP